MNLISVGLELLLAGLLGAALYVGVKLERRLKVLRESHADFAKAVSELNEAVARADHGLAELKGATREAQTALAERTHDARNVSVKLEEQSKIAIDAADRLEAVTRRAIEARPPFGFEIDRMRSEAAAAAQAARPQAMGHLAASDEDDLLEEPLLLRPVALARMAPGLASRPPVPVKRADPLWPRPVAPVEPIEPEPQQQKNLGPRDGSFAPLQSSRGDERVESVSPHRASTLEDRLRMRMSPNPPARDPRSRARIDEDLFGSPDEETRHAPPHALGGRS